MSHSQQNTKKILFIAGTGRNGGTLLDRILGQINGYTSLGEFRFVWDKGILKNELCNCGNPFKQCPFWIQVFETAFGGFDSNMAEWMLSEIRHTDKSRYLPYFLSPLKPSTWRKNVEHYVQTLEKLFSAIYTVSQSTVLIDSSKFAGYGMILGSIPEVELHVVHLIRDSRATAHSWMKQVKKPESWEADQYMKRYHPLISTAQWMYRNEFALALKSVAKSYHQLRYEDFSSTPQTAVQEICNTLGYPNVNLPFISSNTVLLKKTHTQSGNPGRFREGEIAIKKHDEWRAHMPRKYKTLVTTVSFPSLIQFGYKL